MAGSLKIAQKVFLYLVLFLLILVGGFTIYLRFNKENIERKLLATINEQQSGFLSYNNLEVGISGSFPLVSLSFNELRYFENRDTTSAPILISKKLSVVPNVAALLRGQLVIDKVHLNDAKLDLFENDQGELNLVKALENPALIDQMADSEVAEQGAVIDVEEFKLQNVSIRLGKSGSANDLNLGFEYLKGDLFKAANEKEFDLQLTTKVSDLRMGDLSLKNPFFITLESDLLLAPKDEQFFINDLELYLNDISFLLSTTAKNELKLRSKAMFKDLADLASSFGLLSEDLNVQDGQMSISASLKNLFSDPQFVGDFSLVNAMVNLGDLPMSGDFVGNLDFNIAKDDWFIDFSTFQFNFKQNELFGQLRYRSDSSDHFDIWTDLQLNLREENAADSIYALMDISSIFSIDILPTGELMFNDSTELNADIANAQFNRQTIDDGHVLIKPEGQRLHVNYKTESSTVNDIDMQLTVGPFYKAALLPSLETIPFILDLKAHEIDLAYLEIEELKRIADLDLQVEGSIDGLEGPGTLDINLDSLLLFVTDEVFDVALEGDFAVIIDTNYVALKSTKIDLAGTLSDLNIRDAIFVIGDTLNTGQISLKAERFDLQTLGEFLLVDSTHILMTDSASTSLDLELSAFIIESDSFEILAKGPFAYHLADNDFSIEDIDLQLDGTAPKAIEELTGSVGISGFHFNEFSEYPLKFDINYEEPIFQLEIHSFEDMFEGQGAIKVRAELTEEPKLSLDYKINDLDLDQFWSRYQEAKFIEGRANFSVELDTYLNHFFDSLKGKADITGNNWQLYGFDLDDILKDYKRSQNFQLKDVGAFFIMGPFGPVVSKGLDYSNLASIDTVGTTHINAFNVNWTMQEGELFADDMAFSTKENRVAAKGSIDFQSSEWRNLKIAVLNKKGCSLLEQEVNGSISDPSFGEINVIGTLLGPVINVLKIVSFQKCDPFYTGKVGHPK